MFVGSKTGELSISNGVMILHDKIARTLNTHELGELLSVPRLVGRTEIPYQT